MELIIKYDNGQMTINMNTFFPTSQTRLKKLLNVIALDYEHKDEHIRTLEGYFRDKLQRLEDPKICVGKYKRQKELFLKHLEMLEQRK